MILLSVANYIFMSFIHVIMINFRNSNISFNGYDVLPLRGLYMQGIRKSGEKNIFMEMKNIADKEGIDIFVNQDGTTITQDLSADDKYDEFLSIWGQDNKAFVINKNGKTILCNSKEAAIEEDSLGKLSDFQLDRKKYMPRGGEYYLGYKNNGEKWLIINGMSLASAKEFERFGDLPTREHLYDLFDIKPENLYVITDFTSDIDETIRPIGYPNVLVNDYRLALKNLEQMKKKFPESYETYGKMKEYLLQKIKEGDENIAGAPDPDKICEKLKEYGFNPIKIGGRYSEDINYMNALAFKNKKNKISYITNSTKGTYPEVEYLEKLFEKDLKKKVPKIKNTYFVSGDRYEKESAVPGLFDIFFSNRGLKKKTAIMDILACRGGGIHCMTAEIPDFDRIG